MKKYLKTLEEVIDALHAGEKVHGKFGHEYRLYRGFLIGKEAGHYTINTAISDLEDPYIEEPEPLKIKVGKFYKTRAGEKARCYLINEDKAYFTIDESFGCIWVYSKTGCSLKNGEKSDYDIIGPWEE